MKITYFSVCRDYGNFIANAIAHFSTEEKAKAYISKIKKNINSERLKASYNTITIANMIGNTSKITGEKFTYQNWLDEYNDAMFYYNQRIYNGHFYIVSTSVDIDVEPDINLI